VLSDVEEAIAYGRRVASELAGEPRWEGYVIAITDANGAEIARIPIAKSKSNAP
jgi:predicted RNA-binding protein with TRAM domain